LLRAPFSIVAVDLSRVGLGRLHYLDPKPSVQRYEWARPVDLIHIDIKPLAKFRKAGHRITGVRQQDRSTGVGCDKVHVSVDDATRSTYDEVLTDEQKPTVIGFLSRAGLGSTTRDRMPQGNEQQRACIHPQGVRQGLP
jgi:hypothetical protein